jgi:hypothetical protein
MRVFLLSTLLTASSFSQATQPTTLVIDLQNCVFYQGDVYDPARFATNPQVTPSTDNNNFGVSTDLGDIVAVNGQPAKGLYAARTYVIGAFPVPTLPGRAIADVRRTAIREHIFEILQSDGTPVGTIISLGFAGGSPPPGSPSGQTGGNWAIVGGTGAFLGARGQVGGTGGEGRQASMVEDPGNRRINGGAAFPFILQVIPMSVPQIVTTASGPAVLHADFSPVTAATPAKAGEVIILKATALGPTRPGVAPGQPFPTDELQEVNSPVDVTVNGQAGSVVNKIGWPGLVDTYRVDFRVPDGIATGTAAIQLTAAWVAGPAVRIAVR